MGWVSSSRTLVQQNKVLVSIEEMTGLQWLSHNSLEESVASNEFGLTLWKSLLSRG